MAYVIYDSESLLEEAYKQHLEKLPEINGKTLRVLKYQSSSEMPSGNIEPKFPILVFCCIDSCIVI
jgi:hypothetical protein